MRTTESRDRIRHLLSKATSAQEAVRGLYELSKQQNRKMSVAYLCAKAGIPSKGSLADVMSGRRKLKAEHARGLAKAFALPRYETKVFIALAVLETERDPKQRERLESDLDSWRKVLGVERRSVDETTLTSPRWLAKLFTSLSLVPAPVQIEGVQRVLPRHSREEIQAGLEELQRMNLVKIEKGEARLSHSQIVFQPTEINQFQIQFLRDSLKEAMEQTAAWYPRAAQSFFESSLLTVNRAVFLQRLPEIKEFFERLQSDLETDTGADELISLNVQIYPAREE